MRTRFGHKGPRFGAAAVAILWLLSGAWGDEPDDKEPDDKVSAERLEFMLDTVRDLQVAPNEHPMDRWPLFAQPILRWTNPVAGIRDGIVVMWTDGRRPAILAQVLPTKDNFWIHECQALASGQFVMRDGQRVLWEPREKGGEFRVLEGAAAPAATAAKRLIQMRSLAREFTAFDDFRIHHADKEATRHELRLMANPVYRYEMPEQGLMDGGVFPFVLGTDPEVFLLLEARRDSAGEQSWEYLLAPMTCWGLEVKHRDKTVWTMPERFGKHSTRDAYHIMLPSKSFDR